MRLWSKREEEPEFNIPAPWGDGIRRILEYGMDEDACVPEGVTVPGQETISSRRIEGLKVREPGEPWAAL